MAIDSAVSLATATPFLGVLQVHEAARVGYLSGEGGASTLQDYARRVCQGRGIELSEVEGLVFCDRLPQLSDLRHLDALARFMRDWELRIVMLDPLYLCWPDTDSGNVMKQGKVLRYVNQVCLDNGCTPILIHHTKRNLVDPYAPAKLLDLSWAGFAEFAAQWWLLSRRERYDPDQPGEHKLWLTIGGRSTAWPAVSTWF